MRFQVKRARAPDARGRAAGPRPARRIGLEIRTIVAGGLRILDKIEAAGYDVFNRRPALAGLDWARVLLKAL